MPEAGGGAEGDGETFDGVVAGVATGAGPPRAGELGAEEGVEELGAEELEDWEPDAGESEAGASEAGELRTESGAAVGVSARGAVAEG